MHAADDSTNHPPTVDADAGAQCPIAGSWKRALWLPWLPHSTLIAVRAEADVCIIHALGVCIIHALLPDPCTGVNPPSTPSDTEPHGTTLDAGQMPTDAQPAPVVSHPEARRVRRGFDTFAGTGVANPPLTTPPVAWGTRLAGQCARSPPPLILPTHVLFAGSPATPSAHPPPVVGLPAETRSPGRTGVPSSAQQAEREPPNSPRRHLLRLIRPRS